MQVKVEGRVVVFTEEDREAIWLDKGIPSCFIYTSGFPEAMKRIRTRQKKHFDWKNFLTINIILDLPPSAKRKINQRWRPDIVFHNGKQVGEVTLDQKMWKLGQVVSLWKAKVKLLPWFLIYAALGLSCNGAVLQALSQAMKP